MTSSGHTSRPRPGPEPLRSRLSSQDRFLWDRQSQVRLGDLRHGSGFGGRLAELRGRSVLLRTAGQLPAAVAMIELDGLARRVVICPPDLPPEQVGGVIEAARVDAVVHDRQETAKGWGVSVEVAVVTQIDPVSDADPEGESCTTEWVLLTSGTTGASRMLAHTLEGLTGAITGPSGPDVVWGTFYDIRRYGGLQIFLRALLGGTSLVVSDERESPAEHLTRLGERSVTHLTGTPSHWRRVAMSTTARAIRPRYVRLSGEIADQGILDTLASLYPGAALGHAFASTEAGVVFEVTDGREGFPASYLGVSGPVEVAVEDGSLRIRSARTAMGYVGDSTLRVADDRGFVDTGDMVERRGDRYYFLGRRSGVVNVGGQKVYPEEVEAVLARHPAVRMSRVRARPNPITGALVVADVVLVGAASASTVASVASDHLQALKGDILRFCRETLPRHKVPVSIDLVSGLEVAATGKVVRHA